MRHRWTQGIDDEAVLWQRWITDRILLTRMLQELVFQEFSYSSVTRIFTNVPTPRILITLISTDDQIRVDTKDTVDSGVTNRNIWCCCYRLMTEEPPIARSQWGRTDDLSSTLLLDELKVLHGYCWRTCCWWRCKDKWLVIPIESILLNLQTNLIK